MRFHTYPATGKNTDKYSSIKFLVPHLSLSLFRVCLCVWKEREEKRKKWTTYLNKGVFLESRPRTGAEKVTIQMSPPPQSK